MLNFSSQVDVRPADVSRDDHHGGCGSLRLHQQLRPRQPRPSAGPEVSHAILQQEQVKQINKDRPRGLLESGPTACSSHVDLQR